MCSGDSVYFNGICIHKVRPATNWLLFFLVNFVAECFVCQTHYLAMHTPTPTQDDLCGMFESCARCWPINCTSGDCQPRGLEEICESTCSVPEWLACQNGSSRFSRPMFTSALVITYCLYFVYSTSTYHPLDALIYKYTAYVLYSEATRYVIQ